MYSNWLIYVILDDGKVYASQANGTPPYLIINDQVIHVEV